MRTQITIQGAPSPGTHDDSPPDVHFKMDDHDIEQDVVTIEQGGSMIYIKWADLKKAWEKL